MDRNGVARPLAIVTGASRGIGFELTREFSAHGFDLVVAAEGADINDAGRTFQRLGAQVEPIQADLRTYDGVETLQGELNLINLNRSPATANATQHRGMAEPGSGKD